MISFVAEIERFGEMFEKTGWYYVDIEPSIAEAIKPNFRKSFRVKGTIDHTNISGIALLPMGAGRFILALNGDLRKLIDKGEGGIVHVSLEEDKNYILEIPEVLQEFLDDQPPLLNQFMKLSKSHRDYFIKWIISAKTMNTKSTRIALTIQAIEKGQSYSEMIRANRKIN